MSAPIPALEPAPIPTHAVLLLDEFRRRYPQLQSAVYQAILTSFGDSVVLERLGDDVHEFKGKVAQHLAVFPPDEAATLQTNLQVLLGDIRQAFRGALDSSHYGKPTIIRRVKTGRRGRPKVIIDPIWLRGAYDHRGPSKLARFLGCSRKIISQHLKEHGIARHAHTIPPSPPPYGPPASSSAITDGSILSPRLSSPASAAPGDDTLASGPGRPATIAVVSDAELDVLLAQLRIRFPSSGVKILQGTLRQVCGQISQKRIRDSLLRVDPVRRAFQRTPVRRRRYKVAGPGALAHHDGQHGLIRWGVVIHGFIDGASRLIMALQAHDNNRGATVLALFLVACARYGVPQRVRGDHGVENILVAEWMERVKGERRGSYIWGRSVHNIRIERLWVDVTAQFGQKWANFFAVLEAFYGLDINNAAHIWLLHTLFLKAINSDADLWTASWNDHKMTLRGEASQSPAEMWHFGVAQAGVRSETLESHELESYGVDWAALGDDTLMHAHRVNNSGSDEAVPWTGRVGPPPELSEVTVDPPGCPIDSAQSFLDALGESLRAFDGAVHPVPLGKRWIHGLAFCRVHHPASFH